MPSANDSVEPSTRSVRSANDAPVSGNNSFLSDNDGEHAANNAPLSGNDAGRSGNDGMESSRRNLARPQPDKSRHHGP